jgi:hypothetical protein
LYGGVQVFDKLLSIGVMLLCGWKIWDVSAQFPAHLFSNAVPLLVFL